MSAFAGIGFARAAAAATLRDTCDLSNVTETRSSSGGVGETLQSAGECRCRVDDVDQIQSQEAGRVSRFTPVAEVVVWVPVGTAVSTHQRIASRATGLTYEVLGVQDQQTDALLWAVTAAVSRTG